MVSNLTDNPTPTPEKLKFVRPTRTATICGLTLLILLYTLYAFRWVSIPTRKKETSSKEHETVSYPSLLLRWARNPHLTIADLLYQIGLDSDAALVKVRIGLRGNVYLIRSSEYTTFVQNKSKYLTMNPVQDLLVTTGHLNKKDAAKIRHNRGSRKVPNAYGEMLKSFHQSLSPSDEYYRIIRGFVAKYGEKIMQLQSDGNTTIDLYKWIQFSFSRAVSYSIWGETSPYYLDTALIRDWWNFHNASPVILFSLLPAFLFPGARFGMLCRERIFKSTTEYYRAIRESDDTSTVPHRILQYMEAGKKWGFDDEALARIDLSRTLGFFEPPIDASYGLAVSIFSHPDLLSKIRAELEHILMRSSDGQAIVFHAHAVRTSCPLFLSCFYENARMIGTAFSIRDIAEDFILDSVSLKKGDLAIMCGTPVNHNPLYWDEPTIFKGDRFIGITQPENEMTRTYRAFGGGAGICGGRNIAPNLVMAVGSLLLAFDVVPEEGEGKWAIPDVKNARVPEAVTPPRGVGSTMVTIKPREGYENVKWDFCESCDA
ncbi:cytochrome P450 [Rhizodiscina lignyota]|uniref:Cytochrome P450 n=1 Tax=Rhizodiscina lignyota TaxID=1504668 RepID=A0A9P4IB76_9PEZI|nr:cytochrome P450 [Rhizodiscina lignyota]